MRNIPKYGNFENIYENCPFFQLSSQNDYIQQSHRMNMKQGEGCGKHIQSLFDQSVNGKDSL